MWHTEISLCLVKILQGKWAQGVQGPARSCKVLHKWEHGHKFRPAGAAGSPNPPEIAHLLCGRPVHPEIPAFAGRVLLCNLGASACPGHRGPWACHLLDTIVSLPCVPANATQGVQGFRSLYVPAKESTVPISPAFTRDTKNDAEATI